MCAGPAALPEGLAPANKTAPFSRGAVRSTQDFSAIGHFGFPESVRAPVRSRIRLDGRTSFTHEFIPKPQASMCASPRQRYRKALPALPPRKQNRPVFTRNGFVRDFSAIGHFGFPEPVRAAARGCIRLDERTSFPHELRPCDTKRLFPWAVRPQERDSAALIKSYPAKAKNGPENVLFKIGNRANAHCGKSAFSPAVALFWTRFSKPAPAPGE